MTVTSQDLLTATATDADGNTSEFSPSVQIFDGAGTSGAFAQSVGLSSPLDVSADGQITALDALAVINLLNNPAASEGVSSTPLQGDVNGDEQVSALDALQIINWLNRSTRPEEFRIDLNFLGFDDEPEVTPADFDEAIGELF